MEVAFPFRLDGQGRVESPSYDDHIRQMIEQVLFTAPGERVNRPDFGAGVEGFLFGAADAEVATALQGIVQGALQQWLGGLIKLEAVQVTAVESTLTVTVQYIVIRNQQRQVAQFERQR
jgi:phage baseplate assembly protein W